MTNLSSDLKIRSFWVLIFLVKTVFLFPEQAYSTKNLKEESGIEDITSGVEKAHLSENHPTEEKKPERNKLFLGGGDLSYELSFAKKHPEYQKNMVATTYDSEEHMNTKYPKSSEQNKEALQKLGVLVLHKVDATKLHEWDQIKNQRIVPKDIYFSHPHTGNRNYRTSELVNNFFESAAKIQKPGYLLHIPRVRGGVNDKTVGINNYYQGLYAFRKSEEIKNYTLIKKLKFSLERYPGWVHRRTLMEESAQNVQDKGSIEYVFKKREQKNTKNYSKTDSDIASEDESVTFSSDNENEELKEDSNRKPKEG